MSIVCKYCDSAEPRADMLDYDDDYGSSYFHLECWVKAMPNAKPGWREFFASFPNPFGLKTPIQPHKEER